MAIGDMGRPASERAIYLDYHATTPVDARVVEVVVRCMTASFGNASSTDHFYGDDALQEVEQSAIDVGALVGARSSEIIWTSGATEAINLALHSIAASRHRQGPARLLISPTEHSAVLDTCRAMARDGRAEISLLEVDERGRVNLNEIEERCREGADGIAVMAANNEVGTIAPVKLIGEIAARHGVAYLCDATQAAGRMPLEASEDHISFLVLSAHKIYGPQGIGALVPLTKKMVTPLIRGGGHQSSLRAGTLNLPGIAGFGAAARLRRIEGHADEERIEELRDRLQGILLGELPDMWSVNGNTEHRLAGNLHMSFLGGPNAAVVARIRGTVALATGAACSSGIESPSHVLQAMGLPEAVLDGALRMGLGKWTTQGEIEKAGQLLTEACREVQRLMKRA